MSKITFQSDRSYNYFKQEFKPIPSGKKIPEWFSNASKYWIDKKTKGMFPSFIKGKNAYGFKSCPALMDIYTSGYMYVTPCDIEFKIVDGKTTVIVPSGFEEFCVARDAMDEFIAPHGYQEDHFHWWPNWSVSTPEGYSSIFLHPVNHYDLPFITTGGIIDTDMWDNSGLMPFFLKDGFEGILPAGTPFAQVIPFKREDWESDYVYNNQDQINERRSKNNELRFTDTGVYKKKYRKGKIYR